MPMTGPARTKWQETCYGGSSMSVDIQIVVLCVALGVVFGIWMERTFG